MRVLLDTCVVSEIARPSGNSRVKERVAAVRSKDLYLSVITVGEIAKGIALLEPGRKRDRYTTFLAGLEQDYGDRILPLDTETAHIWGELSAAGRKLGSTLPAIDGLIAATSIRHGLQVMTHNVDDFASTGAMLIDPWK